MPKKDVLFLCQFFYPEYISSATLPFDTAVALKDSGKSVGVLCGYPKEYSDQEKVPLKENYEGIEIERVKYMQLKRSNAIGRLINYFSFTLSILFKIHKFKNYESVIVYSNPPVLTLITALANILYGIKVVFVSYDLYPEIALETNAISKNSLIHKVMNFINRITFPRFNKIVALSSEMKEFIIDKRNGIEENQIAIIPNWYEKTEISEERIAESYKNDKFKEIIKENKIIISYFGNMGIAQDMNTILETIKDNADNRDFHFLIAGHGSKKDTIKHAIEENDLTNVTLFDFLKGNDYEDALNISDALIVSLDNNLNGLCVPSKTYGYYSAGKPVIAVLNSEMDIAKEITRYNNGFIIANNDVNAFNKALQRLKNPEAREEMGVQSRKLFERKYTKDICTIMYSDLVDLTLEEKEYVYR